MWGYGVGASDPTPSPPPRPRAGSRGPMASIHDAAERGDVPGVQAALQAGVNPDLRDEYEWTTALHWAAREGHVAVVGALVGGGAAVGAVGRNGRTALHLAAWNGHAAVVEALAGAGAGVDAADENGDTPLSLAAYRGRTEAAAALLGAGADKTRPTDKGKTAAEWAREKGHPAVGQLIEDYLAQSAAALENARAAARQGADALAAMTAAVQLAARDAMAVIPAAELTAFVLVQLASATQTLNESSEEIQRNLLRYAALPGVRGGAVRGAAAESFLIPVAYSRELTRGEERLIQLRALAGHILETTALACVLERRRARCTEGSLALACTELQAAAAEPATKELAIMVFGSGKNGKSTLLNAILGENMLPASDIPCTANTTSISRVVNPSGREIVKLHKMGDPPDKWYEHDLPPPGPGPRLQPKWVEAQFDEIQVECMHKILQNNVRILDVPGLNQTVSNNAALQAAMKKCSILLIVCSATAGGLTFEEKTQLKKWKAHMKEEQAFVVCNKMNAITPPLTPIKRPEALKLLFEHDEGLGKDFNADEESKKQKIRWKPDKKTKKDDTKWKVATLEQRKAYFKKWATKKKYIAHKLDEGSWTLELDSGSWTLEVSDEDDSDDSDEE
eukprot:COSAG01_NODE_686_length_14245_cov_95.096140_1_plen_622_part_10